MPKNLRLQVKAARILLDWHQRDLARAAGVTPQTISSLEGGGTINEATRRVVRAALEEGGVELLDVVVGVSGPGARLKWREDAEAAAIPAAEEPDV
jgi:transcriptional regulator with XRE-family HTH domain